MDKFGKEIRVDLLSDGEKCTLAMFGDLARRMALANPNLVNPLNGEGLVLIDEVELHMHPSWQRRILGVLKTIFPNIQFILTTDSKNIVVKNMISKINYKITEKSYQDAEILLEQLRDIAGVMDEDYILASGFLKRSKILDEKNN